MICVSCPVLYNEFLTAFLWKLISIEHAFVIIEFPDWVQLKGNSLYNEIKKPSAYRVKPITETQVLQVIAKLVNSKATGLDGIPNWALRCCGEVITPSLTFIFNFAVITKIFPDDLKVANWLQFLKRGKKMILATVGPSQVCLLLPGYLKN